MFVSNFDLSLDHFTADKSHVICSHWFSQPEGYCYTHKVRRWIEGIDLLRCGCGLFCASFVIARMRGEYVCPSEGLRSPTVP